MYTIQETITNNAKKRAIKILVKDYTHVVYRRRNTKH